MFMKSYMAWTALAMLACDTIASPAVKNLAGMVPDDAKSVTTFVTAMLALVLTYRISSYRDTESLLDAVRRNFVPVMVLIRAIDAAVIHFGSVTVKYASQEILGSIIPPVIGILYLSLRQEEARRLGMDFSTWFRKLEFPRCLVAALAGLVAIWVYQPGRGMSLEEGMWLKFGGRVVSELAVGISLLGNRRKNGVSRS